MSSFSTFDDLATIVDDNAGLTTVSMYDLREAYGVKRLGRIVLDQMSQRLEGQGLGHVPKDLPSDQSEEVRVFRLGSPVAQLIQAAFNPGDQFDSNIRDAINNTDSSRIDRIRELLEE